MGVGFGAVRVIDIGRAHIGIADITGQIAEVEDIRFGEAGIGIVFELHFQPLAGNGTVNRVDALHALLDVCDGRTDGVQELPSVRCVLEVSSNATKDCLGVCI